MSKLQFISEKTLIIAFYREYRIHKSNVRTLHEK